MKKKFKKDKHLNKNQHSFYFEDFLENLSYKIRKKINKERNSIKNQGIDTVCL